ncbi:chromosome segregation protein SMC [Chelatococcus sp. SYSU_G07232]|uniref:Chromosome partition protein Smc n=1 Tax=Chelatococcus albus TaxID=3047466 RepID=A0ABT7AEN8_9HYPH|nr:chromosome segregation protein SMC [Chelatococcus sp. SYSU_G07232]MDJ1157834.1 chromosome segregation protein SMC [Chelatococcus sp. SYSU_G07232]
MKLTRLRIIGFKTFVEPTEFHIEPGLTGIVGPNGCGKSNLVEALRWVMGESSHKSMRASGMDDVIFGGSTSRPARNTAEVMLVVDNGERTAPAAFNDTDHLEVSRKIEREHGSTYRVNGREVRARDVQLLFADAATGARSPALVRQGQIGEIIAAKPQARRRILEDAAGIAGLHARRHEAELRLKAAEDNLLRLVDVLREIDAQIDGLKRQGRQAQRYRSLSADIRKLEAMLLLIAFRDARAQEAAAERTLEADLRTVADRMQAQAEAARHQALAAHAMPALREAEAAAAAALQRLNAARAELDAEERRARERAAELASRSVELGKDIAREKALSADAAASIERLMGEDTELAAAAGSASEAEDDARRRLAAAEARLAEAEGALSAVQAEVSDLNARRAALERTLREETERMARLAAERGRVERDLADLLARTGDDEALAALRDAATGAEASYMAAEQQAAAARLAVNAAREEEARLRGPLADAERMAQGLETEARTLAKLFAPASDQAFPPVVDALRVAKGYETALGAALGEDLDASTDPDAPAHWAATGSPAEDPPLPGGAKPLSDLVKAPAALVRRLKQIGVVERDAAQALRGALKPGQRLVSKEGDLWRWDGFCAAAEAPSAAARRLAERNRLGDLERAAAEARLAAEARKADSDAAQARVRAAAADDAAAIEAARAARRALDAARERLSAAERRAAEAASSRSALGEARSRLAASEAEAMGKAEDARAALAALAPAPDLDARLMGARATAAECRAAAAEARGALESLRREGDLRLKRRESIAAEVKAWRERATRAAAAIGDLEERLSATRAEAQALAEAPDTFLARRRHLLGEITAAEERRKEAADRLAAGEVALSAADRAARDALDALAAAREARAGAEARLEAAKAKLTDIVRAIAEGLDTDPHGLHDRAGVVVGADLPPVADVEARLAHLRSERERLGAVNLRADTELAEAEGKRESLVGERDDLVEAIRRLRQAIGNLNREGRERLLAAFDVVNGHFQRLFTTLFGGGTAELTLVDADDPLEAGLEIVARPPGKKPQVMTLLSGGEQALTATALIFAVFLTNPSPICVLDEVDAPLDDANVERYCDLLHEMVRQTQTRFVVITHNPITMARMDRLFGVTMAERGVSQLVSVDLEAAERIREAG